MPLATQEFLLQLRYTVAFHFVCSFDIAEKKGYTRWTGGKTGKRRRYVHEKGNEKG